jgi:aspartate carbamoyltransferase catalytic subunit
MNKEVRHILEAQQFDVPFLRDLFERANYLDMRMANNENLPNTLRSKIVGLLFYEPSTRTRWSFASATRRLGGEVIWTEDAKEFSSAVKGESVEDTVRVVGAYCDAIVIRHHSKGRDHNAIQRAAAVSNVPIINAGEGSGQHPTQALLDLYTIAKERNNGVVDLNKLTDLNVAMVGDLANGRTVHSLAYLLTKFDDTEIAFVSPPMLKMKPEIKEYLTRKGLKFDEVDSINSVLPWADVIYMTRVQSERMNDDVKKGFDEYKKEKGLPLINEKNLKLVREDARILHPLPRVQGPMREINVAPELEVDDKRLAYFRQSANGVPTRMALLEWVLQE